MNRIRILRAYFIMAVAVLAAAVGGCAMNQTKSSLTTQWAQSCIAYEGAQKAAIANLSHMSNASLKQLLIVTHQITPLCSAVPADPAAATTKITAAVTTIGVLAAVQGVKK